MRRCESADEQGDPRVLHLGKWDDLLVTRMQGDGGNGGKAMARPDEEVEAELRRGEASRGPKVLDSHSATTTTVH